MLTLDSAQIWTIIGVGAAAVFGMMTLMSTMFVRIVRTEIGSVRSELRTELGSLRTEMHLRFESVERRLDGLDRDVQGIIRRELGS